jgi:hypothetical protein
MALSDLASGGKLNDEQANVFLRKLIDQPTILNGARSVIMTAPQRQINKIGFGSRILRPAVAATALSSGDRSKPTTGQVLLSTKEVIAEVRLPYDVIEDNIERGNINAAGANASHQPVQGSFKDTIISMIAERAALDLEELALLGDTASGDAYLALVNGFIKQATSNVVAAGSATITRTLLKNGMKAMPDKYLRNRVALAQYFSVDNETEYRETLAQRETAGGDALINTNGQIYAYGVPVVPVALMPSTTGLFTHPKNFIFGIQRDISIEVDKDISARVFIIVLTARVDFKYEEEEAVVKYTGISG